MRFMSRSKIAGAAALLCALGVAAVALADGADAIKARRALMKQDGAAGKAMFEIMTGKVPFDAAQAAAATTEISKVGHTFASQFDEYFPDNSKTGDTKAAPALWDNKDEVKKLFASLETDATAATAAASKGADAFKAAAEKVGGDCKGCHEKYKLQ